jgi:hypothetical protein
MDREAVISFRALAILRVLSNPSITQGPAINTKGLLSPTGIFFILISLVNDYPLLTIISIKNERWQDEKTQFIKTMFYNSILTICQYASSRILP